MESGIKTLEPGGHRERVYVRGVARTWARTAYETESSPGCSSFGGGYASRIIEFREFDCAICEKTPGLSLSHGALAVAHRPRRTVVHVARVPSTHRVVHTFTLHMVEKFGRRRASASHSRVRERGTGSFAAGPLRPETGSPKCVVGRSATHPAPHEPR